MSKNFGHAGERFIRALVEIVNDDTKLEELRGRLVLIRRKRSEGVDDAFLLRTVDYFSGVELALLLAKDILPELELTAGEIESAVAAIFARQKEHVKKDNNIDSKALTYLWDCIMSEPGRFRNNCDGYDDRSKTFADKEAWGTKITSAVDGKERKGYAFLPAKLNALLERGGFNAKASTDFFKANRWVWLTAEKQLWSFKMGDQTKRGYVFEAETAKELGILSKEETCPEPKQKEENREPPIPDDNPFL